MLFGWFCLLVRAEGIGVICGAGPVLGVWFALAATLQGQSGWPFRRSAFSRTSVLCLEDLAATYSPTS